MNAKESIMKFADAGITGLAHVTGGGGCKAPKAPKVKSGGGSGGGSNKGTHGGGSKGGGKVGSKGGGSKGGGKGCWC